MIDQRSKPRIIVKIEQGLVEGVYASGIDLSMVDLILIDCDTEGADREELHEVGDAACFFSVAAVQPASEDMSRDVGRAYLAWSLK